MIQMYTYMDVADNTGAKEVMCIQVLGGNKRRVAHLGDIIRASVKKAIPGGEVKPDDVVEVVAGDDKGTRGKVLKVLRAKNQVVVEGVNRVYRHLKPSKRNPQGGRLSKEMPINASNVMFVDPARNAPTRVGVRYLPD